MTDHDTLPPDVVELWWCPVCGGAAHRTARLGRPKIYCSNACRQRAYRWRRDHCARTIARPGHRATGAVVCFGRTHALRTPKDYVGRAVDQRGRRPTVCGVLARPNTLLGRRTHYDFVDESDGACRTCAALIAPPLDPLAPFTPGLGGQPERQHQLMYEVMQRAAKPSTPSGFGRSRRSIAPTS